MGIKDKQLLYRPEQILRVLVGWGSQISRQVVYEVGKVVSPTHWSPSWHLFLLEAESTIGP
jgi:hypothetical protein